MANQTQWNDLLEEKLIQRRVDVTQVGQTLNVKAGRGITAAKANIDPAPLWAALEEADGGHERLVAGYVSGVKHVLLEPKRSDAADWDFVKSAGRLTANVEVHTFALGAEAAAGDAPWTEPFFEDLIAAYFIELDVGIRVLTQGQFDRWSAPAGRVSSAARSILFHKSRGAKPEPLADFEEVEKINVGDGYDAMRSIVVSDLFFAEFRDAFRFAMPTQDALLFVRGDDQPKLEQLRAAADSFFEGADYPISRSIYGFESGKPALIEPRQ
jgi:hypothetical protein